MSTPIIKELGQPKTTGEMVSILSKYPAHTPFGFCNQPIQELKEAAYPGKRQFVSFYETKEEQLKQLEQQWIPVSQKLGYSAPVLVLFQEFGLSGYYFSTGTYWHLDDSFEIDNKEYAKSGFSITHYKTAKSLCVPTVDLS